MGELPITTQMQMNTLLDIFPTPLTTQNGITKCMTVNYWQFYKHYDNGGIMFKALLQELLYEQTTPTSPIIDPPNVLHNDRPDGP